MEKGIKIGKIEENVIKISKKSLKKNLEKKA